MTDYKTSALKGRRHIMEEGQDIPKMQVELTHDLIKSMEDLIARKIEIHKAAGMSGKQRLEIITSAANTIIVGMLKIVGELKEDNGKDGEKFTLDNLSSMHDLAIHAVKQHFAAYRAEKKQQEAQQ